MREGNDAGKPEQQIVARNEQREDADLCRDVQRLRAGEEERRESKRDKDGDQDDGQDAAAWPIAGEDHHLDVTGKSPRGRQSSTATISMMSETSASFGTRKPA